MSLKDALEMSQAEKLKDMKHDFVRKAASKDKKASTGSYAAHIQEQAQAAAAGPSSGGGGGGGGGGGAAGKKKGGKGKGKTTGLSITHSKTEDLASWYVAAVAQTCANVALLSHVGVYALPGRLFSPCDGTPARTATPPRPPTLARRLFQVHRGHHGV